MTNHVQVSVLDDRFNCSSFYKFFLHSKLATLFNNIFWRKMISIKKKITMICPGTDFDFQNSLINNYHKVCYCSNAAYISNSVIISSQPVSSFQKLIQKFVTIPESLNFLITQGFFITLKNWFLKNNNND